MDYFIIGDVHGCYHTLCRMLENWNPQNEHLIFVGDLIDRGNFSSQCIKKCMELDAAYGNVTILKGNHEAELIQYFENGNNENWIRQVGEKTLADLEAHELKKELLLPWLRRRPLKFETGNILVTHAGISAVGNPYHEEHEDSVLWNRKPIINIGKLQVHGHIPLMKNSPEFNMDARSWNIDTAAAYGYSLTGLKISEAGEILGEVITETDPADIARPN